MEVVKMQKDIILSVVIISYNQEKYIRDAIESVLNQKTRYKYEILLADDCSPDNTNIILKEYEEKYPDLITVLHRQQNLGANNNTLDATSKTKGKYIAILEGDDYWCDINKIETQVDFLEKNPEYICVSHPQEGRDSNNNIVGFFPKKIDKNLEILNLDDLIKNNKIFSYSSSIHKNIYIDSKHIKNIEYLHSLDPIIGDAQMCEYLCTIGKVYVMAKPMMVYRVRNNDGNSNFNSSYKINQIEYRYLKIYNEEEKFYDYKYNYYNKIKRSFTLGVAYDICTLNFNDIKNFRKECPSKYKLIIYLLFPITCVQILWTRFITNRSGK